jgi:hypothetical protein
MTEGPKGPTLPTVLFDPPFSAPELLSTELLINSQHTRKITTLFGHYAHREAAKGGRGDLKLSISYVIIME